MTGLQETSYQPIAENKAVYERLYAIYRSLHDAFGGVSDDGDLGAVMKELLTIKEQQAAKYHPE